MLAAKHFDPVMGVDIHIIQPPGPVPPLPIPHPFIGMVLDPADYIPFIGATVYVNGVPRATAGTEVKPTPPHIPIGGMFVTPPGNEGEIFMGSSTVLADAEPFSRMGEPVLSCQSVGMIAPVRKKVKTTSMVLPTSVVLPIPAGMLVMVGGPPTISLIAIGMRGVMGAFKKLKKLRGSDGWVKKMSDKIQTAAKKVMDDLKVPSNIQDKVSDAICAITGHPVDIASGRVFTRMIDFELPGPIPLKWERAWFSSATMQGPLGHGWHHIYNMAIAQSDDGIAMALRSPDGRGIAFPHLEEGESFFEAQDKLLFFRDENGYAYRDKDQLIYRFSKKGQGVNSIHPLVKIENKAGFNIQFKYNPYGYLTRIIDSAGRQLEVRNGPNGRITAIHVPNPKKPGATFPIVSYEYDEKGNLIAATDALDHKGTFEYDGHLLIKETDKNGLSFYFEYIDQGDAIRCSRTWGDDGIYNHKLTYNNKEKYTVVENSLGHHVAHFWNDQGLVWKAVDADKNVTLKEWGENTELLSETDALGRKTEYAFDDQLNIIAVADPAGGISQYNYNEADQLIAMTDPNGANWSWQYNEDLQLTARINPEGDSIQYGYDEQKILTTIEASGTEGTTQLFYDQHFNLTQLIAPDKSESSWSYDQLGRCTQAVDPNNNLQRREFDLMGQLKKIKEPDGNTRSFNYDPEGNVVDAKDIHQKVKFKYAAMGRLKSRIEGGTKIEFDYNTEQDLIGLSNEKKEHYFFQRNKSGAIVKEVGFDGLERTYLRDAAGQVNAVIRPSDRVSKYQYDKAGRIYKIVHHDGATEIYHYDLAGNLLEAINEYATVTFERDALGRVTHEWQNGFSIDSEYDGNGRTKISSSFGANIEVQHDDRGFVEQVNATQNKNANWEAKIIRDANGLEIERSLNGGIKSQWKRDSLGRPIAHNVVRGRKSIRSKMYSWDSNDRLLNIIDGITQGRVAFSHDTFGNLVRASYSNGEQIFRTADKVGNLFKTKNKSDRKYGKGSRLLSCDKWNYKYDVEGNLVQKSSIKSNDIWEYEWYANGMLAKVIRPDKERVTFKYDALGRRIEKTFMGSSTHWVWDGNVPLHEWRQAANQPSYHIDEVGNITAKTPANNTTWVFEPDSFVPMAKLVGDESYSIITDYLGTPAEMYNSEGERSWACELDIYGKVRIIEGDENACPFRYQGQYADVETGLYYNRFRYYDAERGGYVSQDPIGLAGGNPNMYGYVSDSNITIDIFGLKCKAEIQPYRSDVLTKGPHVNININGNKITEALLELKDGVLSWRRFGDMGKASKKALKKAQKKIDTLLTDNKIMSKAKDQVKQAIDEMKQDIVHGTKKQKEFAERNIPKFEQMLDLF